MRLLGRFLLCEPNRKREQSVFLEKNSCVRVRGYRRWWRMKSRRRMRGRRKRRDR